MEKPVAFTAIICFYALKYRLGFCDQMRQDFMYTGVLKGPS